MSEITLHIKEQPSTTKTIRIIEFIGQLDETNVDLEANKIYEVIDSLNEPNLILDFSQLTYMNSKSIGYVTDWYSRTAAKNGMITIAKPQPNILDILKVVGITQIVSIYESIEEALKQIDPEATFASSPATPAAQAPVPPTINPQTAPANPTMVTNPNSQPVVPAPAAPTQPMAAPTPASVAPVASVPPAPQVAPATPVNPVAPVAPVAPENTNMTSSVMPTQANNPIQNPAPLNSTQPISNITSTENEVVSPTPNPVVNPMDPNANLPQNPQ